MGLQGGLYTIQSIISESDDLCIYIAKKRGGQQFVCCEVKSLELINRWITDINAAAERGKLICFTESSFLYIITHYYEGENAAVHFRVQHTDLRKKLEMLRCLTFSLIDYSSLPDIILKGMLSENSVCVYRGEMVMNCFISPNEQRTPLELYAALFNSLLTEEECKRLSYINIILQKLKNGIYTDFMQVYLDINQTLQMYEQAKGFVPKLKRAYEKSKGWLRIIGTAAVLIVAAVVIINMLNKKAENSTQGSFTPIDHIGTVSVISSQSEDIREIHVSEQNS